MSRRKIIKLTAAGSLCSALAPLLARAEEPSPRMPAIFVGHGTPLHAIWDNAFTQGWAALGRDMPKPRLILSISAHWITQGGVYVTGNEDAKVVYDVRGFPRELYQVRYDTQGDPDMARDIVSHIKATPAMTNNDWGYDHGTWVPLSHMYPDADIPVLQLSVNYAMPAAQHYQLGQEIAYLRERGVLVMGSGNFVHNLPLMGSRTEEVPAYPWAEEFSQVVGNWVDQREFQKVVDFQKLGGLAKIAHPTYDHFLPLLPILGMVHEDDQLSWSNEAIVSGSMDMKCLVARA